MLRDSRILVSHSPRPTQSLTLNPSPSTHHPQPITLNQSRSTPHPQPITLNPSPSTNHAQPITLNQSRSTHHPQPLTLNQSRSTPHPQPLTLNPSHRTHCARYRPPIRPRHPTCQVAEVPGDVAREHGMSETPIPPPAVSAPIVPSALGSSHVQSSTSPSAMLPGAHLIARPRVVSLTLQADGSAGPERLRCCSLRLDAIPRSH